MSYTVLGTVPWIPGNLDFFFPLNQVSHLGVTNLVAPFSLLVLYFIFIYQFGFPNCFFFLFKKKLSHNEFLG